MKIAIKVPTLSGPNDGETDSMVGCEKSRKLIRKFPVTVKYSGSSRLRNIAIPEDDEEKMFP